MSRSDPYEMLAAEKIEPHEVADEFERRSMPNHADLIRELATEGSPHDRLKTVRNSRDFTFEGDGTLAHFDRWASEVPGRSYFFISPSGGTAYFITGNGKNHGGRFGAHVISKTIDDDPIAFASKMANEGAIVYSSFERQRRIGRGVHNVPSDIELEVAKRDPL